MCLCVCFSQGKYPIQPALPAVGGNEGVAVIQEVGPDVTENTKKDSRLAPGVRRLFLVFSCLQFQLRRHATPTYNLHTQVWVLPPVGGGFGTWRTHAVAPASSLRLCPSGLTLEAAAQLSVNPVTALRLLTDFVELKPGDVVIQNAANSAVGRAVLQLACARGLRVVCLVRDRPGIQAVMEELRAMGAAAVACTSSLDGGSSKKRQEALRGLPPGALGLNAVGGPSACEVARLLAPGATMVTYGGMSKQSVELSTGAFIFRDLRARGFWLTAWTRTASPADVTKALEECATAMRDGKLIAAPTQVVHGLQALPDALRAAGSPGGIKLLVRMDV